MNIKTLMRMSSYFLSTLPVKTNYRYKNSAGLPALFFLLLVNRVIGAGVLLNVPTSITRSVAAPLFAPPHCRPVPKGACRATPQGDSPAAQSCRDSRADRDNRRDNPVPP